VQFQLRYQREAEAVLANLQQTSPKKYKKVLRILGLMQTNLRHPSLKTHKYESLVGPGGEEIFEAYVENNTPGAWRIFWYYGPQKNILTIFALAAHP
jgi:hypothetical protein